MPAGFSDTTRQQALDIRTRLQSGESVPREDLLAFLKLGEKDLAAGILADSLPPKPVKPPAPKDVDFF